MERKEGLPGACKYCGQIVPTQATTQEEADRIATKVARTDKTKQSYETVE
mgnify:CR=1 FL=1